MSLRFGSVCSGIEAASQAWQPLGWSPTFFAEIEKFPSAVLAHHYGSNMPNEDPTQNGVPNYGDMSKFKEWPVHGPFGSDAIDLLCGGTPCQSFSIAGLRGGLDDQRGNLSLTFGAIARRYRPRWLVWENVPGVLSSGSGGDFASILGFLAGRKIKVPATGWQKAGIIESIAGAYGLAWRVLDAQFIRVERFGRAVPQRRRRIVLIGYIGDWRRAAAVLFERESMFGNPAPRREAGQGLAQITRAGVKGSHWDGAGVHPALNQSHGASGIGASNQEVFSQRGAGIVAAKSPETFVRQAIGEYVDGDVSSTVSARDYKEATDLVAHTLLAKPNDSHAYDKDTYVAHSLTAGMSASASRMPHEQGALLPMVRGERAGGMFSDLVVRRLTPIECERLQGFPDDFTRIPWRGKAPEACPDGPRYKALGNSWAVNMFAWVGQRIAAVDAIDDAEAEQ